MQRTASRGGAQYVNLRPRRVRLAARQPAARSEPVWTFAKALVTPIFWLLMVSGTLSLFTLRMVTVHQTAHLVDQGIP
ncbi:MAG: hypothetical protein R3A10_15210 [Caldilineaceae bacterium]